MFWLDLFTSLGFAGFYTLWALLVGSIAVLGVISGYKKKGMIRDLIFSWAVGVVLVSISPIGSLVFAAFARLIIIGLKRAIGIKSVPEMLEAISKEDIKITRPDTRLLKMVFLILIALSIFTMIFAPPMEVGWYEMRDANIIEVESGADTDVNDVVWEDIEDMRLVSQEYALQIPKTMVTETGWKLSDDWDGIYPINDTLYWVIGYEPTRLVNIGNPSPAYILVNAQNPSERTKIKETIEFSEERSGLFNLAYQLIASGKIRDISTRYWLEHPYFDYGDTVLTHDDKGEPAWLAPVKLDLPTIFLTKFYTDQVGVAVLYNDGRTVFYSEEDIENEEVPEWILDDQPLVDEEYSMIRSDRWAKYAQWEGFLNYYLQHENVYEIAKEFYFQHDKSDDDFYGIVQLEPEGRDRKAITHYIDIDSAGPTYGNVDIYDTRSLGLIGPQRALDDVRGEISLYSDWYPLQPLFKNLKGGYFYVVPIYSGNYESMVLKAVAVVDAKSEQVKLFPWGELEGIDNGDTESNRSDESADLFDNCKVISSETADGKVTFTIECQ